MQLNLALAWNRIDVAKSEIFTDETHWTVSSKLCRFHLVQRFATCKETQEQSWIPDSTPRISDSRYWIPVFVSGTWILDSNR